jgi:predicted GH43/DUF377 family glycosyl hydrolase
VRDLERQLPDLRCASHGRAWMLDRRRLLPATYLFNPTIAVHKGSIWMSYRRISPDEWLAGPRTLGLCRLGPDLQPDADSNIDLSARISDPPGADRWHADPRLFHRNRQLWMSYHDNYRLFLMTLEPERMPKHVYPQGIDLIGRKLQERERNWGFFDDGVLKAVYTIHPHIVLSIKETAIRFEASDCYETVSQIPWDIESWGPPHGGSMPIRIGRHWFAFFQSASYDPSRDQRHYCVGFYGFDAEPPHKIRLMSTAPILEADSFEGERSFYRKWSVVYPSGAFFLDGRWLVSLGIHDRDCALVVFDHAALLKRCAAFGERGEVQAAGEIRA